MDQVEQLISKYGPAVWNNIAQPVFEAAYRKAIADGISDIIWLIGWVVLAVVMVRVGSAAQTKSAATHAAESGESYVSSYEHALGWSVHQGHEALAVLGYCAMFGAAVPAALALAAATDAIQHLINPQWYAIANLLGTIKK